MGHVRHEPEVLEGAHEGPSPGQDSLGTDLGHAPEATIYLPYIHFSKVSERNHSQTGSQKSGVKKRRKQTPREGQQESKQVDIMWIQLNSSFSFGQTVS